MDTQKLFFVIEVAEKIFHGSKHHSSKKKSQNWPPISKFDKKLTIW